MSEYSVEEVRAVVVAILRAYAERIKVDDRRLTDWREIVGSCRIEGPKEDVHHLVKIIRSENPPAQAAQVDVYEAYKTWPDDIRKKLSLHDLRRMGGWAAKSPVSDWRIDTSAGVPILCYQDCSVIESEQARYVLNLISADQNQKPTAEPPAHAAQVEHQCRSCMAKDYGLQPTAEPAAQADGMCNADNPARRCVCREEFGRRVCEPGAQGEAAQFPMTEQQVRQWIDACNHEPSRQVLRDYLRLREAQPRAVPDGWVLVPREPTDAMCAAAMADAKARKVILPDGSVLLRDPYYFAYKAMLAAAGVPSHDA